MSEDSSQAQSSQELSPQEQFRQQALDYHEFPIPGKIAVELTKPANSAEDLALAYLSSEAEPVREIAQNVDNGYKYT